MRTNLPKKKKELNEKIDETFMYVLTYNVFTYR